MFGLFKKAEPEPAQEDEASEADLKSAHFIQQKCQIGSMFSARLDDPNEDHQDQLQRYHRIRDEMIARLDTIDDEFSRGFGAHQIIRMCVNAKEAPIACALLVSVRDEFIREKILEEFPQLVAKAVP